jgi:hypothetical protein
VANTLDPNQPFPPPRPAGPRIERRRSPRWNAHVPLFVYGHAGAQGPFHEEAYSTAVSDRGALLIMATEVAPGDRLLLINKTTEIEQECHVARVGHRNGPSIPVGVEFDVPAPLFWRITAPPRSVSVAVEPQEKAL